MRIVRARGEISTVGLRIVLGFNNSPGSVAAVESFALRQWRQKTEIRLVVVTELLVALIPGRVFQTIRGISDGRMKGEQKWVETLAAEALETLRNAGLSATLHVCSLNPRLVLVQEAEKWQADLIFVGANSFQSQFQVPNLGCVASAIASRVSCSVEIVR